MPGKYGSSQPRSEATVNNAEYQKKAYIADVLEVRRLAQIEHNDAALIRIKVPYRTMEWIKNVIAYREGGTVE